MLGLVLLYHQVEVYIVILAVSVLESIMMGDGSSGVVYVRFDRVDYVSGWSI